MPLSISAWPVRAGGGREGRVEGKQKEEGETEGGGMSVGYMFWKQVCSGGDMEGAREQTGPTNG